MEKITEYFIIAKKGLEQREAPLEKYNYLSQHLKTHDSQPKISIFFTLTPKTHLAPSTTLDS